MEDAGGNRGGALNEGLSTEVPVKDARRERKSCNSGRYKDAIFYVTRGGAMGCNNLIWAGQVSYHSNLGALGLRPPLHPPCNDSIDLHPGW